MLFVLSPREFSRARLADLLPHPSPLKGPKPPDATDAPAAAAFDPADLAID